MLVFEDPAEHSAALRAAARAQPGGGGSPRRRQPGQKALAAQPSSDSSSDEDNLDSEAAHVKHSRHGSLDSIAMQSVSSSTAIHRKGSSPPWSLTPWGLASLAPGLQANTALTHLVLSGHAIGNEGVQILTQALQVSGVLYVCCAELCLCTVLSFCA